MQVALLFAGSRHSQGAVKQQAKPPVRTAERAVSCGGEGRGNEG